MTLFGMIRGNFNFWELLAYNEAFTHFYFYSYYIFTYGLVIGLLLAIMNDTYRSVKSQMYYKSTLEPQDYEMIDFMMKRFKLWAGITKPKPVSIDLLLAACTKKPRKVMSMSKLHFFLKHLFELVTYLTV